MTDAWSGVHTTTASGRALTGSTYSAIRSPGVSIRSLA